MVKTIKTQKEIISYEYNDKEIQDICKRVLENNKLSLCYYWDYNDNLTEEQIYKIITEEEGIWNVEDEIYENSFDYISQEIEEIINNDLTEEEKTDDHLREVLGDHLRDNYDFNIKDLYKNSEIRLRLTLFTNYEYIDLSNLEDDYTLKQFKKIFKDCYDKKELINEIHNNMGSNYVHIVFYFKLNGYDDIMDFRKQYLKRKLTLKKGLSFGLFNKDQGCGSILEMTLKKDIKINLDNWIKKKDEKYFEVLLHMDKESYGINEVYGLTSECWKDF